MIFGRKNRKKDENPTVVDPDENDETFQDADDDLEGGDDAEEIDHRADGPFDYTEVDLEADEVERIPFGPLIVTPFPGMNLQLHGDEESQSIYAALALYENSGLELALFAAPRTGGLADELREDTVEESEQAGGSAEVADGPFGPEVRRVLPMEGPEGEQMFHVSRIWMVEGPRWLLRGTLMGQAGMTEGEEAPADTFVEFFRNIIVRRDDAPRVPGELITLALPESAGEGS
ncbi:DUF3710 domain-containing protein [Nigerium massiliense]|uniref:DUF3710 domain-containing protein n=1 Tax=Nigerium massiliense TaxID=1522317 RepID=UPI0006940A61|nr:DUF3710 domain-containing protein [Nigerium massiliense]